MSHSRRMLPVMALAAALQFVCSGCVVVPIRQESAKITDNWKRQTEKLKASAATQARVREQLGSPTFEFNDLRVIGYRWDGVEWEVYIASIFPPLEPNRFSPVEHRLLWIAFDAEGKVAHWDVESRSCNKTAWEQARDWCHAERLPTWQPPPRTMGDVSPQSNEAALHVFWSKGETSSSIVSVQVDQQRQADLRSGCFTSLILQPGSHQLEITPLRNDRLLFEKTLWFHKTTDYWPVNPIRVELQAGESCFVEFSPHSKGKTSVVNALSMRPRSEVVKKSPAIPFCR